MIIGKDKIPKSMSFVLRSGMFEDALCTAGITTEISLRHVSGRISFDAFFWPPRPNVPHERFYVRAGSVPTAQARAARAFVEHQVIPDFIAWAGGILLLPADSPIRRTEQVFAREFVGHIPNNSFKPTPLGGAA